MSSKSIGPAAKVLSSPAHRAGEGGFPAFCHASISWCTKPLVRWGLLLLAVAGLAGMSHPAYAQRSAPYTMDGPGLPSKHASRRGRKDKAESKNRGSLVRHYSPERFLATCLDWLRRGIGKGFACLCYPFERGFEQVCNLLAPAQAAKLKRIVSKIGEFGYHINLLLLVLLVSGLWKQRASIQQNFWRLEKTGKTFQSIAVKVLSGCLKQGGGGDTLFRPKPVSQPAEVKKTALIKAQQLPDTDAVKQAKSGVTAMTAVLSGAPPHEIGDIIISQRAAVNKKLQVPQDDEELATVWLEYQHHLNMVECSHLLDTLERQLQGQKSNMRADDLAKAYWDWCFWKGRECTEEEVKQYYRAWDQEARNEYRQTIELRVNQAMGALQAPAKKWIQDVDKNLGPELKKAGQDCIKRANVYDEPIGRISRLSEQVAEKTGLAAYAQELARKKTADTVLNRSIRASADGGAHIPKDRMEGNRAPVQQSAVSKNGEKLSEAQHKLPEIVAADAELASIIADMAETNPGGITVAVWNFWDQKCYFHNEKQSQKPQGQKRSTEDVRQGKVASIARALKSRFQKVDGELTAEVQKWQKDHEKQLRRELKDDKTQPAKKIYANALESLKDKITSLPGKANATLDIRKYLERLQQEAAKASAPQ